MANNKSTVYANSILDALFGDGSPATIYIALFTSAPTADGTGGTEVAGGSYARAAVTNNATEWPAAAGGVKSNANAIVFATASANWGTVTHVKVMDNSSGGNIYYFGPMATPRTINNGDTFSFAATQFVVEEN